MAFILSTFLIYKTYLWRNGHKFYEENLFFGHYLRHNFKCDYGV